MTGAVSLLAPSALGLVLLLALWHGWLPRVAGPIAWGATLAAAGMVVALVAALDAPPLAAWPAVALLAGHLGWQLGRRAASVEPVGRADPQSDSIGDDAASPRSRPSAPASRPPTVPPPTDATMLGRYRLEGELGQGAMGTVYLGRDPQIGRPVALKTLALGREFHGEALADARERFFREAESAGRLQHPDIVTVYDAGEAGDLAYIAMELLRGHDLGQHVALGRLLPVPQVLHIVARVADALAYAHSQGVIHRDIKPANVMIDEASGAVKVTDFGVARIGDHARTRTGIVVGTPSYMSPEQMAGRRLDGRSDLYSLGVMLFQLLTGSLPHAGDSMARLMYQIANEPAPDVRSLRADLPEALADVVALALEKRPEVRYADGRQFAQDLRAVVALADPAPDADKFRVGTPWKLDDPRHNSPR